MKATLCDICRKEVNEFDPGGHIRVTGNANKVDMIDVDLCPTHFNDMRYRIKQDLREVRNSG